jgi:ribosomal subunit interface protein
MISDTQVLFRNIDHSPAVEEAVHKRVAKLQRFSDEIQSLRVILEAPHNNHHKGKVYHVGVEASIPNHELVITRDQHDNHAHEDLYVAVRDAFDALERRLKAVYEKNEKQRRQGGKRLDEPVLSISGV